MPECSASGHDSGAYQAIVCVDQRKKRVVVVVVEK